MEIQTGTDAPANIQTTLDMYGKASEVSDLHRQAQQGCKDDSGQGESLRMKIEELPGIVVALFIPSSPSPNLGFAWDIMTALVAGAGFEPATFGL